MSVRGLRARAKLTLRLAQRAMRDQGFCVVGVAAESPTQYEPGDTLIEWGGGLLPGDWELRITGHARRTDWDRQFVLLFPKSQENPAKQRGQRFYTALLERACASGPAGVQG